MAASPGSRYTWTPYCSEAAQAVAESVQRVSGLGEVDPAAQADPVDLPKQVAVAMLEFGQQGVEAGEIAVLAIVVDHEAVDHRHGLRDPVQVRFAQAAEGPGGVGQVIAGHADAGVQAQPPRYGRGARRVALELRQRVEDDLVGAGDHVVDVVLGIGHAVGMGLAAEFLAAQADFEQRRRCRAVHVLAHQVEYAPGGEALEREQDLRPGSLADAAYDLQVLEQGTFVDQVVRRFQHGGAMPRTGLARPCVECCNRKVAGRSAAKPGAREGDGGWRRAAARRWPQVRIRSEWGSSVPALWCSAPCNGCSARAADANAIRVAVTIVLSSVWVVFSDAGTIPNWKRASLFIASSPTSRWAPAETGPRLHIALRQRRPVSRTRGGTTGAASRAIWRHEVEARGDTNPGTPTCYHMIVS